METKDRGLPIHDSERVNFVFKDQDGFVKGLGMVGDFFNLFREMGLEGVSSVSMDNSGKNPIMSFAAPKDAMKIFCEGLDEEGVDYLIDVTKSDEPDSIKRS